MFKFMVFSTLIVCALSAPTEKSSESNTTDSLSQKKTILVNDEATSIVSIDSPHQNDKREKREDLPAPSSSENKRNTPVLSQPDYQENKPPTFVHPVPVDQIIRNSQASPLIHSSKHVEEAEKVDEEEANDEEESKAANEDDDIEEHKRTYHKSLKSRTNDDDSSRENH